MSRAVDELLVAGPVGRVSWEEAQELDYRPAELGERFGPLWTTYWFRVRATVPDEWNGRRVELLWSSLSEAALWRDGRIVQGLNTGGAGERPDAVIARSADPGAVELWVEMACNGMFGATTQPAELRQCELALVDVDAWKTYFDFETLRALEAETTDEAWSGRLREQLERFCDTGDTALLAELYDQHTASHAHELAAIGHAHIDTAWLWPLAETYRKCLRSFSSQLQYMEDYPDYRFACSQAQQYAWIKERNPDLWERIRARIDSGQYVPVGGSWVEPDCNLPSGESLLRQFLYGQRFFEQEFGRRHREFWSPDAFGYAGTAPADSARVWDHALSHPEALLESLHEARAPHLRLAGRRRQRGARTLPAGRHVQLRGKRARAAESLAALPRPRLLAHEPARLRLRRRRRRPDTRHARDAGART